jgi:hypothetical protein
VSENATGVGHIRSLAFLTPGNFADDDPCTGLEATLQLFEDADKAGWDRSTPSSQPPRRLDCRRLTPIQACPDNRNGDWITQGLDLRSLPISLVLSAVKKCNPHSFR